MDAPGEQALVLVGVGLVFAGAWGGCLAELYHLPFSYELLQNAGMPMGLAVLTTGLGIRMLHHRTYAVRESGLQLIARADEAMYAARRDGKDRVVVV